MNFVLGYSEKWYDWKVFLLMAFSTFLVYSSIIFCDNNLRGNFRISDLSYDLDRVVGNAEHRIKKVNNNSGFIKLLLILKFCL